MFRRGRRLDAASFSRARPIRTAKKPVPRNCGMPRTPVPAAATTCVTDHTSHLFRCLRSRPRVALLMLPALAMPALLRPSQFKRCAREVGTEIGDWQLPVLARRVQPELVYEEPASPPCRYPPGQHT